MATQLNSTEVKMTVLNPTLEKIKDLEKRLDAKNKADAVGTAIDIAEIVTQALQKSGRVVIEAADGTRSTLTVPGLGSTRK